MQAEKKKRNSIHNWTLYCRRQIYTDEAWAWSHTTMQTAEYESSYTTTNVLTEFPYSSCTGQKTSHKKPYHKYHTGIRRKYKRYLGQLIIVPKGARELIDRRESSPQSLVQQQCNRAQYSEEQKVLGTTGKFQ